MADDRLGRDLRKVDAPDKPRPEFTEALFARLLDERSAPGQRVPGRQRGRPRAPRGPLLLAAALLIGAALVGTVASGGLSRPTGDVRTSDGMTPSGPAVSPTPTRSASARPSATIPPATPLPISRTPSGMAALSGDGAIVYEERAVGKPTRLRLVAKDGTGRAFAPDVPGTQIAAAWSPDGAHAVFAAAPLSAPAAWRLWQVSADGGSPVSLSAGCELPDCLAESEPSYASDGQRIAFIRTAQGPDGGPGTSVLAIRDLASGEVTLLPSTEQPADRLLLHPSVSPDGSTIAFAVSARNAGIDGTSSIWSVGTDDTGLRSLTSEATVAGDPAWSPDGARILFATYPIRTVWAENQRALDISHLYTMAPDGSDVRRLPLPEQAGGASWVPGGGAILYTAMVSAGRDPGFTWLMTVDADATELHTVSRSTTCCSWYAVQQPTP